MSIKNKIYLIQKKTNPEFAAQAVEGLKGFLTRRWKKYRLMADNLI